MGDAESDDGTEQVLMVVLRKALPLLATALLGAVGGGAAHSMNDGEHRAVEAEAVGSMHQSLTNLLKVEETERERDIKELRERIVILETMIAKERRR